MTLMMITALNSNIAVILLDITI